LSAPLAGADVPDLLGLTATEYVSVIKRVLSNEIPLFDQLAKTKASSAASDIYNDCADIQKAKSDLRNQIQSQMITRLDLNNEVHGLDEKLRHWVNDLNAFSNEIKKIPDLDSDSLRLRILDLSTHKLPGLDRVRDSWNPDDLASRKAALKHLDAAIADLQEVQRASKCLSDSINSKQAACDAKTLSPLTNPGKSAPE
jgi:chromosome segregation ATPase